MAKKATSRIIISSAVGKKGGTADWIRKNKGSARFKTIIKRAMRPYLLKLNKDMDMRYKKAADSFDYTREGSTTLEYRIWAQEKGKYPRAKSLGGRQSKVTIGNVLSDKFMLSGRLRKLVTSCRVEVIGSKVHILTPHYTKDYQKLDPTKTNVSVKLSEVLEARFPKAKHTRVAPRFLKGGAEYIKAIDRVNAAIAREANKK